MYHVNIIDTCIDILPFNNHATVHYCIGVCMEVIKMGVFVYTSTATYILMNTHKHA